MTFMEFILFILIASIIVTLIAIFINRKRIPNVKTDEDVLEILNNGNKTKAIKAYRQLHGASLKEAKHFLDNQLFKKK